MNQSIFDLFRIGIGPSSSHTVGPMRAARSFLLLQQQAGRLPNTIRVTVDLYGSLALTGRGHQTDNAVLLGLAGGEPETIDPKNIAAVLDWIRARRSLSLLGEHTISFDEERDVRFHPGAPLTRHPNGLRFICFDQRGAVLDSQTYYSVGGGAIVRDGDDDPARLRAAVPYPFASASELLALGRETELPVWSIVLANEAATRSEQEIRDRIFVLWRVMRDSIEAGLKEKGYLPGGLNVPRRAPLLYAKLQSRATRHQLEFFDWLNALALAVCEENAAGGRIVTAPTNGAAGIVPAVVEFYRRFFPGASEEGIFRFFLTAGAIGILYKENASISGAEVGCQGEIGVGCSMAAAGLVGALRGTNEQVEHAAEIAMEHHLGMTCDPIAGLVQIPCIERNAMGAVKAVNACRLAMDCSEHRVSLDQVIRTMYQTGLDMQSRYKETSLGGLALCAVEC